MPDFGEIKELQLEQVHEQLDKRERQLKEDIVKATDASLLMSDPKFNIFANELDTSLKSAKEEKDNKVNTLTNAIDMTTEEILALRSKIIYINAWIDCMQSSLDCLQTLVDKGGEAEKIFAEQNGAASE